MTSNQAPLHLTAYRQHGGALKTFLIVLLAIFIAIVAGAWVVKKYIFPTELEPVALTQQEKVEVNAKLKKLGYQGDGLAVEGQVSSGESGNISREDKFDEDGRLVPERYSEEGAVREVRFSQKELNGMLAASPEMAERLAVDLSDNMASAKLLIPIPEDFPVMAGQTMKINAGLEMSFVNNRPSIVLKGVSLWGVPVPNAWLGNLKNVDLISQFGDQDGFWKAFADGIETLQVQDGELYIKLKE